MSEHKKRPANTHTGVCLRLLLLAVSLVLTCCTSISELENATEDTGMFSAMDFAKLQFLQGRWEGKGPDGGLFYEEYRFDGANLFRSTRYKDISFTEPTDGSIVEFADGHIIAKWLEYSWQASEISPGKACFAPLNAPSSFCWEQIDAVTVHVTQSWKGEDGAPQQFVMPLRRL